MKMKVTLVRNSIGEQVELKSAILHCLLAKDFDDRDEVFADLLILLYEKKIMNFEELNGIVRTFYTCIEKCED